MLEFKNKKIMVRGQCLCHVTWLSHLEWCLFIQLDCGIHPGLNGMDALPYTDMIEAHEIDLLLITQCVAPKL